jgi:hypothetical protein
MPRTVTQQEIRNDASSAMAKNNDDRGRKKSEPISTVC